MNIVSFKPKANLWIGGVSAYSWENWGSWSFQEPRSRPIYHGHPSGAWQLQIQATTDGLKWEFRKTMHTCIHTHTSFSLYVYANICRMDEQLKNDFLV